MSECKQCADCCRHIAAEIDPPDTPEQYHEVLSLLAQGDVQVFLDHEDSWCILIEEPCSWLKEHNLCGHYPDRPTICREYSSETCTRMLDDDEDEEEYAALFTRPEEFAVWYRVSYPRRVERWGIGPSPAPRQRGYACVDINDPYDEKGFNDICWFLLHRNISVFLGTDGVWYLLADRSGAFARSGEASARCGMMFHTREQFMEWMHARECASGEPERG